MQKRKRIPFRYCDIQRNTDAHRFTLCRLPFIITIDNTNIKSAQHNISRFNNRCTLCFARSLICLCNTKVFIQFISAGCCR